MEKEFETRHEIEVVRTKYLCNVALYEDFTHITINRLNISALHLQRIIDQIFFFGSVDYHLRFSEYATHVFVNSRLIADKFKPKNNNNQTGV